MKQSNGFLPLAPLMHADPTSVGVWDLDSDAGVTSPLEPATGTRDQLVLARIHQEPLTIMHVPEPPGEEDVDALTAAAWRAAGERIVAHIRRCGCLPLPRDAAELRAGLEAGDGACPQSRAARPAGRAAVILCTIGREQLLARTLDSLLRMSCENFEVIVVDNRPDVDSTRRVLQRLAAGERVRYVAEPRAGLAAARNAGLHAADDAEFVAFTDDDVVVDRQWLSWLLEPFSESGVTVSTGLVLPLALRSTAEKRFEQYAGFGKGVARETYDNAANSARERFLYPYWGGMFGSGNSMAFRRASLLAAGGFDPALGAGTATAGGEDLAAFTDLILDGGRLVYEPRSLCWHEHRGDERALRQQVRNYGIGLTAVLWRYFTSDWRFSATLLRSLPSIVELARSRSHDREADRLPADLARVELRGRLLGPWMFMASSRRVRRSLR
jgi:glycosyltransferase involved in cell wall biosynthesis